MGTLVKLVGIAIVAMVVAFITKPNILKKYIDFWSKEERVYPGAVIAVAIGVLLLFAAPACTLNLIVVLVGLMSIVKGVLLFVVGPKKIIKQFNSLAKLPPKTLRLWLLISLAIGVLLIYAA